MSAAKPFLCASRVVLPTREAQQSVKFALARIGTENAVVISRLVGGSAASEVRPVPLA